MKKIQIKILISFIILLLMAPIVKAEEGIIFKMKDPVGDEYGPGTYTYPKSEQFSPYEGLFDLTYFKVEDNNKRYNFYFKFVEITNPWHAKYNFSHQLIQVYIDNAEEGSLKSFKAGANIKFEERHPWNKLIKVTGWSLELFDYQDDEGVDARIKEDRVKLLSDGQTIKVSVPKSKLGSLAEAKYYVLIGSLDGFGYDNYRGVIQEAKGWKFGGGTKTELNPNVIDTLVPEGMDQKEVLGSFDLETGDLATLRAVGPELGLPWKFAIIFGFSVLLIATILGAGTKYIFNFFNKYN